MRTTERAPAPAVPLPVAPPTVAAETAPRLAALETCRREFAALAERDASGGAKVRAADIAGACAGLYREPACAAAMRHPASAPERFAASIAVPCRDAYCPRLTAPRPKLCASADLPRPSELLDEWRELNQHILALELRVPIETLSPLFSTVTVPVRPSAPAVLETSLQVAVVPDGHGGARAVVGGRSVPFTELPPNDAFAALVRGARSHAFASGRAVLSVDGSVQHALTIAALDVLRREGFTKVSFVVTPATTGAGGAR